MILKSFAFSVIIAVSNIGSFEVCIKQSRSKKRQSEKDIEASRLGPDKPVIVPDMTSILSPKVTTCIEYQDCSRNEKHGRYEIYYIDAHKHALCRIFLHPIEEVIH